MPTLADYYIQIVPSAEGISGQLSSIMDGEASKAGASATSSFGSAFGSGLSTVATIGAASFGVFTAAVAGGTAALSNGISSVAKYGDEIDKASQKVGMSTDSYQQWDYVMNLAGTSMSECSMGMKTLTNQIDDAKNGSEGALSNFEQLGISLEDLNSMSREDIWAATIEGMQNLEDSTERAALANDLFGRSGQNMTPLFNMTNEELQDAISATEEYNMLLSEDGVKAAAAYQDSLTTMSSAFSGLKNNMLAEFLPSITTVMDGLTEVFAGDSDTGLALISDGVSSFVDSLSDVIPDVIATGSSILTSLITAISENSGALLDAGANAIIELANGLISSLPSLTASAGDVIMKLGDAFLDLAPDLVDTGLTILENLLNGIGENLDTIIPTVTSVILEITSTLIDHLDDLISAGLTIFLGIVEGLIEAIPIIVEQIPTLLDSIITTLTGSLDLIVDAGLELFSALVDNMPAIIDAITTAIPEILDSIISFWTGDGVTQMLDAGITLFVALVGSMGTIITQIVSAIPGLLSSIISSIVDGVSNMASAGEELFTALGDDLDTVGDTIKSKIVETVTGWIDGIKDTIDSWKEVGKNLITGLWNGISDKASWLYDQITGMGSTIVNKVKSLFGVASPSKVFMEIGGYLAEGLGEGWDNGMKDVTKDINEGLVFSASVNNEAASNIPTTNDNADLNGARFTVYETINLGDTKLKDIISEYTIQKIGNETRAVKVAQGGYYGI